MNRLKAYLNLVRLRHSGQVIAIVTILSLKSHGISMHSVIAIASSLFLCVALFAYDDAHDYASDVVVHSSRPIPQGTVSVKQGYLIATTALFIGIVLSSLLQVYQTLLFLGIVLLGLSVIFLKIQSIGRALLTATLIFLLFPFSMAINLESLLFGLMVVLPHIAGSISKDFIHTEGDEKMGLHSPAYWARYVASLLFIISGGIVFLPIVFSLVTWIYVPLILPTFISCLFLGWSVLKQQYQKVYIYGGIGMLSTLLAIALNL